MDQRPEPDPQAEKEPFPWRVMLWIAAVMFMLSLWTSFTGEKQYKKITYSEFKQEVKNNRVEEILFRGDRITGLYLREPGRFRQLGAKVPKGILLMGPPGTGKTLLAKAVAGEADVPFFSISGSEFIEMFVGVGASRVRDMFDEAEKAAPAIIFIDEIDSVGRTRGTGLGGGHDEREQTLNQILAEMDGFEPESAVVVLEYRDPLAKVTIVPRGRALGVTEQMPEEDHYSLQESYLHDRIKVLLGGRLSEQLVYGEVSSGAEDDLKQATQLARRMISQWGMSDRLGPVAFRRGEEHIFLGREMTQQRDFSEHTAELIDEEVRKLVSQLEDEAETIIKSNRITLDKLARQLLEKEVLDAEEINAIIHEELAATADPLREVNKITTGKAQGVAFKS